MNKICNVASEIQLAPVETEVYINDFVPNCKDIDDADAALVAGRKAEQSCRKIETHYYR